jgi:hypothetical protein
MLELVKKANESKLEIKNEPMKSMMGMKKNVNPPSRGRLKFANPNFT